MKICSRCKESKPYTDFGKMSKSKDGHQYHCRKCKAALHQEKHTDRMKSITASKARRVERNRKWGWNYLLEHPCSCGQIQPRYLEWDHDDPSQKKNDVSTMILAGYGIEALEAEAAKCTVRCLNCHRDRTIEQFGYWVGNNVLVPVDTAHADAVLLDAQALVAEVPSKHCINP